MAVVKKEGLSGDTILDIVATKGDLKKVGKVTYSEWLNMPKVKGWLYRVYQVGSSS